MDAIQLQNAHEYWLRDVVPDGKNDRETMRWLQDQEVSRMLREREKAYGTEEKI